MTNKFDLDTYLANLDSVLQPDGARKTKDGVVISKDPDYCHSPNVVIPYTIYAKQHKDANTAPTVRMTKMRSHTSCSIITECYGDEGGAGGGIDSGTHNSICRPKTWSPKVFIEGNHAVRDTDEWWMNNGNTYGKLYYFVPVASKQDDNNTSKKNDDDAEDPGVDDIKTGSVTTTTLPADGWGNIGGGIEFDKWMNQMRKSAMFSGTASGALKMLSKAIPVAVPAVAFFGQPSKQYVGFFDRTHNTDDPNVVAILNGARESWNNLDSVASLTGADIQWRNHWENALDSYQAKALAGDFGPTTQGIATVTQAGAIPQEYKDRLTREGIKVVGAAASAAMLPCLQFACPPQIGKYRGGAYWCTKMPTGDGLEAHHMPAKGYGNKFPAALGPSIQIEPSDHWKTASHPKSGKSYAKQASLLAQGMNSAAFFEDALDMSVVEGQIGEFGKYTKAVAQAAAYNDCLVKHGLIK